MSKKICTLLLLLVFSFSLVAAMGCSQEEKEFLQLINAVNNLNTAEGSGEMSFSFNLPSSVTSTASDADALVFNLLQKGITIQYTSKQDVEKNMLDCSFVYVDKATGKTQELIKILSKDNVLYLKIDELVQFAASLNPQLGEEYKEIFGDTEYLSLTKDEYLQMLNLNNSANTPGNDISMNMLRNNNFVDTRANRVLQNFMLGLTTVYENYQPNLVTKDANGYTLTMNGTQLINTLPGFLMYSLENSEALSTYITASIDKLTNEDLAALGLTSAQKEQGKASIQSFSSLLELNKEASLQQIDLMQTELKNNQEQLKGFDGFSMKYTIKEKGADTYNLNADMEMNLEESGDKIGFSMNSQSTITAISSFDITVPTAKVMSFTELQKLITKTMNISVDQKTSTYTDRNGEKQEQLDAQIIDNYTYLPLRQIATTFDEKVDWDATQNKAYVMRGISKIDMTGTIINERTYIKIRDFNKLGYQIDWDELTRTVKIAKTF